jgi:NAD(P)-dependent dehydrogenase (short-subunit alcohol dehydrogenase family)
VITGRDPASLQGAVGALGAGERVLAVTGDVCDAGAMEAVWKHAADKFGGVDIWINNAGAITERRNIADLDPGDISRVVATNLTGTILASRAALRGMLAQGRGKIFNFEGFGSDGMSAPGMTTYGATKRAITYFTQALVKETKGAPLIVGTLSPGMVATDLLQRSMGDDPKGVARARRIYNIIADRVETVAPFLAREVLAAKKTGAAIKWMTPSKAFGRFLSAPFVRRNVFD